MEKAVAEHLLEERIGRVAQEILDRMAGGDESLAVVDPDAGDALGGQDRAAGALPIDLRHAKSRVAREILAELGGGGRLEAQIHLEIDRLREGLDDLDRLQSAQRRPGPLDQLGQPAEQVEVAGKGAGDPRTQDLDRDLAPVGRHREMDLRDRGRGDRGFVETREPAVERRRELRFDQRPRLVPGKGRQAILQAREILGDLLAQQIGAGRKQLAELDKAGPQFAEGGGEPLAWAGGGGRAATAQQPHCAQQRRGAGYLIAKRHGREQRVMPRQRQADPQEDERGCGRCGEARTPRGFDQSRQAE